MSLDILLPYYKAVILNLKFCMFNKKVQARVVLCLWYSRYCFLSRNFFSLFTLIYHKCCFAIKIDYESISMLYNFVFSSTSCKKQTIPNDNCFNICISTTTCIVSKQTVFCKHNCLLDVTFFNVALCRLITYCFVGDNFVTYY